MQSVCGEGRNSRAYRTKTLRRGQQPGDLRVPKSLPDIYTKLKSYPWSLLMKSETLRTQIWRCGFSCGNTDSKRFKIVYALLIIWNYVPKSSKKLCVLDFLGVLHSMIIWGFIFHLSSY